MGKSQDNYITHIPLILIVERLRVATMTTLEIGQLPFLNLLDPSLHVLGTVNASEI